MTRSGATTAWLNSAATLLTPRRLRAHATILAVCLWIVCAFDFLTPSVFDRAANIKFQDFLSFYISGDLIAQGRTADLYNEPLRRTEMLGIAQPRDGVHTSWFFLSAQSPANVSIPNLYGPQVALLFVSFARLPFLMAAQIWVVLNLLLYFICVYVVWRHCDYLRALGGVTAITAVAFPPLFHFFVRGQLSVLVLACFTAAFLALRADRRWLAGIALGFLIFKPQFMVAIPLILLLAQAWKLCAGMFISAAAQLVFARIYFGAAVMRSYFDMLMQAPRWISSAELRLAPIQMHSLRSFWQLLIPFPSVSLALYALTAIAAIAMAAVVWKSKMPLSLRFSALTLAAILANPHVFVYDLLVFGLPLLLLTDWIAGNHESAAATSLAVLLYLAFVLPLFGPVSRWTHLQLSVPVFAAILWILLRFKAPSPKLATTESRVV